MPCSRTIASGNQCILEKAADPSAINRIPQGKLMLSAFTRISSPRISRKIEDDFTPNQIILLLCGFFGDAIGIDSKSLSALT
jgi:hypothetical protein